MAIQIQLRRGTAQQWATANTVLALAEIAVELETSQYKIGDGVTHWSDLPYGGIHGPMAGTDAQVIFNNKGIANGSPAFTFNYSTNTLNVSNTISTNTITSSNLYTTNATVTGTLTVNTINITTSNSLSVSANILNVSNAVLTVNATVSDTLTVSNTIISSNTFSNTIFANTLNVTYYLNANNLLSIGNVATIGNNFILGANLNNGVFEEIGASITLGENASHLTNGPGGIPWYAPQGGTFATQQNLFFANSSLIQLGNSTSYFNLSSASFAFQNENAELNGSLYVKYTNTDYVGTATIDVSNYINVGTSTMNSTSFTGVTATFTNQINVGDETTNISINATSFSGTSNNTLYVGNVSYDNVVSNSQLSSNLANYSNTYLMLANVTNAYTNAVYYTNIVVGNVNTAITANAANAYSNSVYYTDTVIGFVNTAITSNASAAYTNATTFSSNASNITNGTLGETRLPYRMDQSIRTTDNVIFKAITSTDNVSIGTGKSLIIGANTSIDFDTNVYKPAYQKGRMYWDEDEKTIIVYGDGSSSFEISLGQREWVRTRNSTASTILKGTPVYITGVHIPGNPVHGHHPTIAPGDASDYTKSQIIGITGEDIAPSAHGYTVVRGYVEGLDTSALVAGQRAHLGFSVPGTIVLSAPEYPNYPTDLGMCLTADATVGTFYVDLAMHTAERFRTTQGMYVGGDLSVAGNLSVTGNVVTTSATNLSVSDNLIYLGGGDTVVTTFLNGGLNDMLFHGVYEGTSPNTYYVKITSASGAADKFSWSKDNFVTTVAANVTITTASYNLDNGISIQFNAVKGHTLGDRWSGTGSPVNVDLGWTGNYNDGTYQHTGLFRDASDGVYKFFQGYIPEPSDSVNIDTSHASFKFASVQANSFTGNLIGTATNSSKLGNIDAASYQTLVGLASNVALITSNNATYAFGKIESALNVNNATYVYGKTEGNLNVNNAVYSNNATYVYGKTEGNLNVNNATYVYGKTEINLNVNNAVYANNSTYVYGKTEGNLNVNNAVYANNTTYVYGKLEGALNVNNATYVYGKTEDNLNVNNATYAFGKTEGNLNVNNAVYSNNATYVYGKTEDNLNVNNATYAFGKTEGAINANNAGYLGSIAASSYQLNSTLNANIASYLPTYDGVVNASSLSVGSNFVANSTEIIFTNYRISANGTYGSDTQVLKANSTGGVYWGTGISDGQSMVVNNFTIVGALSANSSNGTLGQYLTSNGSATYWSTLPTIDALSQTFTGDGSTVLFTLSTSVGNQKNIVVSVNGLIQIPVTHYTISGTSLTFTDAPWNGSLIEARNLESGTGGGGGGGGGGTSSQAMGFISNILYGGL